MSGGTDGVRKLLGELAEQDSDTAVRMLNDESLQFGTLYTLQTELSAFRLYDRLSPQRKNALQIAGILAAAKKTEKTGGLETRSDADTHAALHWILTSGFRDDGTSSEYERILELSAILLTKRYKDTSVLPLLADMAFMRHRAGHLYYDLVWAFLEAREPRSLPLIARYLCSGEPGDVELARRLLYFVPCIRDNWNDAGTRQYSCTLQWLQENLPFLYYTGESFQQTSHPKVYAVSLEAKYLCKNVSVNTGKPLQPWKEEEQALLNVFGRLNAPDRRKLADFSYRLYCRNLQQWSFWLDCPLAEQNRLADMNWGGLS